MKSKDSEATKYEVLARKYRPQNFQQVLGQDAIVTTLRNALRLGRTAHAYLFSGARGTGKTTLARLFAKALNCLDPQENGEPCGLCASCKEISRSHSLDVIEIDGASNRGIDDIRQINETVGYAASGGKFKIYIIDEVHMLTKEAFNALLKTLEEPPKNVKFFFATTEPHKVLPTILSRCQHFQLRRIPRSLIIQKLRYEAEDLGLQTEEEALALIAKAADGGMRDAESLFDQVLAFTGSEVKTEIVAEILGLMPRERYFLLDKAAREQDFAIAFILAREVFDQGKDLSHFIEGLVEHYRTILLLQITKGNEEDLSLSEEDRSHYLDLTKQYNREQCLDILDMLLESQRHLRQAPSQQIALEGILLRVIRSQRKVPVDALVRKLLEVEKRLEEAPSSPTQNTATPQAAATSLIPTSPTPAQQSSESPSIDQVSEVTSAPQEKPPQSPAPPMGAIQEDPTPKAHEIPQVKKKEKVTHNKSPSYTSEKKTTVSSTKKKPSEIKNAPAQPALTVAEQSRYDTLVQFAAVELDGAVEKKR